MTQPGTSTTERDQFSLLLIVAGLLRHRLLIAAPALLLGLAGGAIALARPRVWVSDASFIAQARSRTPALSEVAAQFGVSVQAGEPGQSAAFYADLLRSRALLAALAVSRFSRSGADSVPLIDILGIGGETEALRVETATAKLRRRLDVSVSPRTGVVSLGLSAPSPAVAQQATARLLALLNDFNISTLRSQAIEERRFTEQRLGEVRAELRVAEDRLVGFIQNNRDIRSSPRLLVEQERLLREVGLRQQVVQQLAQAAEQAKIDAVRDTPVITVIQRPMVPARPAPHRAVAWVLLGALVGGFAGLLAALWRAQLARARSGNTAAYMEYREALGGRTFSEWLRSRLPG
jgi:uncharacterized protein involved in exopolysaccharide biosynthesis